jgi:hypothetical protein
VRPSASLRSDKDLSLSLKKAPYPTRSAKSKDAPFFCNGERSDGELASSRTPPLVKRGVMGSFHKVSKKYLPLYLAEFCFRYNNREYEDIFSAAVSGC